MSVATDLRAAADYLRTYGWMQGGYGYVNGPRCLAGAIYSAAPKRSSACLAALAVITGPSVTGFNDNQCDTVDDAIAVLEIAADLATPLTRGRQ